MSENPKIYFEPWNHGEQGEAFRRVREKLQVLNSQRMASVGENADLLREILPNSPEIPVIQPPFYCDYGTNICFGERVYMNYNCVILDVGKVTVGSYTMIGPNVQIYAVSHPLEAERRRAAEEWGEDVVIGADCWIGGGAVICPGVTIGDRCVVAAGAVVTKDVPSDVMVAGVPARVIRSLK